MIRRKKPGRPKMPENKRKIGFSVKLRPALYKAVESQRGEMSRSEAIEIAVEEKYLPKVLA